MPVHACSRPVHAGPRLRMCFTPMTSDHTWITLIHACPHSSRLSTLITLVDLAKTYVPLGNGVTN
ncbi:hypothetical protein AN958_02113 [Leucoagaricus sp. SymC.cos]|nr:hypothetical protein AN958_02113 [Leucoagaricus sp. SymC.cos]